MNVPTILSDANVQTGSTGPTASPDDFGGQVGQALAGMSRNIESGAVAIEHVAAMKKQQQHLADLSWAGQSVQQESDYIHKWMADPVNNSKDTYADDLHDLLDQRQKVYESAAKNPRAKLMFQEHFLPMRKETYDSALLTTAQTKLHNAALGIDKMSGDAMSAYRNALSSPNVDAGKQLINSVNQITDNIDKTFGTISPKLAAGLKEKTVVDATYAAMTHDPKLATNILGMSKTLDEHERYVIMNHINSAMDGKNTVEQEAFKQYRLDQVTNVRNGKSQDKIGLEEYQAFHPDPTAQVLKMRDDAEIDIYNKGNDFYDKVKGWNTNEQQRAFQELADKSTGSQGQAVVSHVAEKLRQNIQLQQKNPISWLQQNNPVVKDALKRATDSTDAQRLPMMRELYDMMLKYQGYPSAGDTEKKVVENPQNFFKDFSEWGGGGADAGDYVPGSEPTWNEKLGRFTNEQKLDPKTGKWDTQVAQGEDGKQFLGKASDARHLMTVEQAESTADTINNSPPEGAVEAISRALESYPDEKYQHVAFNDLVSLPGQGRGIKQEYQGLYMNRNSPQVHAMAGAIKNGEALAKIEPEKKADFEKALMTDKNWVPFMHSLVGDNSQRAEEVQGFKNLIMSYAYSRSIQNGEGAPAAIKSAAGQVISQEAGFANVNGTTMMVLKNQGVGKPYRTDDDIKHIGRNLELSLQFIDPKAINLQDPHGKEIFPALAAAGTDKVKHQAIRDAITMNGTFHMAPDGQSATLYYQDKSNNFEVRDKNNRPFRIKFEDVQRPNVFFGTYDPADKDLGKMSEWGKTNLPEPGDIGRRKGISGTGAILSGAGSGWNPFATKHLHYKLPDDYSTNWPTPEFIKH